MHKNDLNEEICLLCAHNIFQIKSKKIDGAEQSDKIQPKVNTRS